MSTTEENYYAHGKLTFLQGVKAVVADAVGLPALVAQRGLVPGAGRAHHPTAPAAVVSSLHQVKLTSTGLKEN